LKEFAISIYFFIRFLCCFAAQIIALVTFLFARCCAKYGAFDCAKIDERPHFSPKLATNLRILFYKQAHFSVFCCRYFS
jgi:hypothetical protein